MKIRMTVLLTVAALAGGLSGCTNYPYHGDARTQGRDYDVRMAFTDRDRAIIWDYYHSHYRNLPPGLAKKGKVPPGHMYKMHRHQNIPAEVKWQYLPPELDRRLNRLPAGYVRVVIGDDVGLLYTRSRVVLDVIEDLY